MTRPDKRLSLHSVTRLGAVALTAMTAIALSGCAGGGDIADSDGPISIGISQPLAAAAGGFGQPAVDGAQLAVDAINADGGIDGRELKLSSQDNACNATDGATAAEKLIQDGALAIIGGLCSDATLPVLPIAERSEIPLLVDLASNPAITEDAGTGGNDWVFRWAPSDRITAQTAIKYLASLGEYKTISVIADDGAFGQGGAEAIESAVADTNLTIASTDLVNLESPDFASVIARVSAADPDVVVVWLNSASTVASFYEQYAASALATKPLAGQLDMAQPAITDNKLFGYNSAAYSTALDTAGNTEFLAAWTAAGFDDSTAYVGWDGYQSALVLAEAIRNAKSIDPVGIRDALEALDLSPSIVGGAIAFDDHNQAHDGLVIESFTGADRTAQLFLDDSTKD